MKKVFALVFLTLTVCSVQKISAQTTEFTYQGSLQDGANPANGNYDFEFRLFDLASGGVQQGSTVQRLNVAVANGIFTVSLDFGSGTLPGADRFLDIEVRTAGGGAFTALSPRQRVNSAPYSVKSLNAASADTANNALQLGGVAANQYVVTTDPRMTDARTPTAGSTNYIQNTTALQSLSNFNVSGTGTANVFNSTSDYHVSGFRVLSTLGTNNVFVGIGSGLVNTGARNAFFGRDAGEQNTSGERNSFFGYAAGQGNITGGNNSFFGTDSGASNNSGFNNSFFGSQAGRFNAGGINNSFFGNIAGRANLTGVRNSFFGAASGTVNTIGEDNTFVGSNSGTSNTSGFFNSFFGSTAGQQNSTGGNNSFFGRGAGLSNTTGSNNTVIGDSSNVGAGNLNFATAIGAQAVVGTSNTVVLGRPADTVQVPGTLSISGSLSAGVLNASTQFNIGGNRVFSIAGTSNVFAGADAGADNSTGTQNSFFGQSAGANNTTGTTNAFFGRTAGFQNTIGEDNSFFGANAGQNNSAGDSNTFVGLAAGFGNSTGSFNSFFGVAAGQSNTTGDNNTIIGSFANVGSGNLSYATALGAGAVVSTSNSIVLGRADGSDFVRVPGVIVLTTLSSAGSTQVCRNGANVISTCSSSLRYKTNINRFGPGLSLINQLRPITFDWKEGGMHDLGLGAEDVAAIEPLLVTYNKDGQVEGVKYDRIGVVLVNAVKEQQSQIETQQLKIEALEKQNQSQHKLIEAITIALCSLNPATEICKQKE
ncbi:MAG: tail fiber domain-containing protein [Chloracidobacterium sp.]|nr:tail fiber domain-containing protein [Chloracidobacterium sp.]